MTSTSWVLPELRRAPRAALALPLIAAAAITAAHVVAGGFEVTALGFALRAATALVSLSIGLAGVAVLTGDGNLELLAATPTSLATTLVRRVVLVVAVGAVAAAAMFAAGAAPSYGSTPAQGALSVAGSGALLTATALVCASRSASPSAASLVVMGTWLTLVFYIGDKIPAPLDGPLQLLAALALVVLSVAALGDPEPVVLADAA